MAQRSPLTDFSPDAIAAAIEQNGVECCLSWAVWPGMEVGRNASMVWTITDVSFPFFNNVFNVRLPEENVESAVEETVDRFRQRNVSAFWWTGPATRPVDLGRHLEVAGWEHALQAPAMALDLAAMKEATSPPSGLTVEEIVDRHGLQAWCRVMTPIYQFPDLAAEAWYRMLASLGLGPDRPLRHFLARIDGKPVATASLYIGAGVAGISSVATLPEHRGRGIGRALTVAVLQQAKQAGWPVATLFSSVMGRPMYERIGFQQYGKGNCYLLPARQRDVDRAK